jgi:hypothetical protein
MPGGDVRITRVRKAVALTSMLLLVSATLGGAGGAASGARRLGEAGQVGRSAPAGPEMPSISLVESRKPTCYRPELESNACFVNWGSTAVSTSAPRTIVSMTLTIGGQMRANYQGFFQDAMEIVPAFHGAGFQVPCGPAGVDGVAGMGHTYDWALRARDSQGLQASSSGTLTCPALDPTHIFLPMVRRGFDVGGR